MNAPEGVSAAIERIHGAKTAVHLQGEDDSGAPVLTTRAAVAAVDDARYQVLGEIARGGVGVVYRGRDKDLHRDVALKVLRADHADDPDVVQRFIEEAQVGGQLQHPGIVPIYGMGLQPDGRVYFAMKLIRGRTLSALLDANRRGVDLLSVFEQVAQTIAYAHSRGVIHRDLKPANIMVGSFGEVMVVDWGFAKVLGHERPDARPKQTVIATVRSGAEGSQSVAGSVMGTPAYMPPEQALGHVDELDERSDVFALGAILCEILTGRSPYGGPVRDQLLAASQCRVEKARARIAACEAPAAVKAIAYDCLQPLGKDRPKDAGVIAQRLSAHLAAVEERVRRAELDAIRAGAEAETARRARQRTFLLAAVALVAILGSGGGYLSWRAVRDADRQAAARRVTAALAEAANRERAGDRDAAIAAARRAVDVATTNRSGAAEARAMLSRLRRERREAADAERIALSNAALARELDELRMIPRSELSWKKFDALFADAVARHIGDIEDAPRRLAGSPYAAALGVHFDYAARVRRILKKEFVTLVRLARAIDPRHNALRDVCDARDPERLATAIAGYDIEGLAPQWIDSVGVRLYKGGRKKEALALLRAGLQVHPANVQLNSTLGELAFIEGDVDEGVRRFRAAIAARPDSRQLGHLFATHLSRKGRLPQAARVWKAVLRRHPDWSHGVGHFAHTLQRLDQLERAQALLEDAMRRDRFDPSLPLRMASLAMRRGEFEEAARWARKGVTMDRTSPFAWNTMGAVELRRQRYDEALAAYRKARAVAPELARPWIGIANVHETRGEHGKAIEAARSGLRRVTSSAPLWQKLGHNLALSGKLEEAEAAMRRSLALDGYDSRTWLSLAHVLLRRGKTAAARAADAKAEALTPASAPAWHNLATERANRRADYEGAVRAFRRADALRPDNAHTLRNLGRVLFGLGRRAEALRIRRRAVELAPKSPDGWRDLAESLLFAGRFAEASRAHRKAFELGGPSLHRAGARVMRAYAAMAKRLDEEPKGRDDTHRFGLVCSLLGRDRRAVELFKREPPGYMTALAATEAAARLRDPVAREWFGRWLNVAIAQAKRQPGIGLHLLVRARNRSALEETRTRPEWAALWKRCDEAIERTRRTIR